MDIQANSVDAIFRHPFLLLLAAGLISQYLIPRLTRRWQDHQKEIEIKMRTVSDISQSVLKLILAVQLAERGAKSQSQEDYDTAYKEWEVSRAILSLQIRAYFRDLQLAVEWDAYSEAVTQLYVLSGTIHPHRNQVLDSLKTYFPTEEIDWDLLLDYQSKSKTVEGFHTYFKTWWSLREHLLNRNGELTRKILESPVALFGKRQ